MDYYFVVAQVSRVFEFFVAIRARVFSFLIHLGFVGWNRAYSFQVVSPFLVRFEAPLKLEGHRALGAGDFHLGRV